MPGSHGKADRLLPADLADLAALDAALANEGEGEEGARLSFVNAMLGPRRFGRMFRDLPPFRPPDDALTNLGMAMLDPQPQDATGDSQLPAGFTYLGQFIDHDLTLDPTVGFPVIDDPDAIQDGRNPAFDLDSVYGLGPVRQPELYDPAFIPGRAHFLIGLTSPSESAGGPPGSGLPPLPVSQPHDLPRRVDKTAIIPDSRNDENLVVAQTHLAFLKFHNRVIDTLPQGRKDEDRTARFSKHEEDDRGTAFHRASRLVRWHYQWIVLHDFLARIVDPEVLADVLENGRRFFQFHERPFMPVEFSVAGYRLGHTLVREAYNYNRVFKLGGPPAITPATLGLLFRFTGRGSFRGDQDPSLPTNWVIDWRRFHEVGRPDLINFARRVDTRITGTLHKLPASVVDNPPPALPVRNLLRGSRIGLPKAQDVARAIGATPLTRAEIASGSDGPIVQAHGFDTETPLWYYILKEAEQQGSGLRLGQVGSRIVSEVFVGLLEGDRNSFLAKDRRWKPTLPSAQPGTFTMADLLSFVGELNPIGPGPEGP